MGRKKITSANRVRQVSLGIRAPLLVRVCAEARAREVTVSRVVTEALMSRYPDAPTAPALPAAAKSR